MKDTFGKVVASIKKSSSTHFKNYKVTSELEKEKESLDNLYVEIGRKVHEIYLYGGTLGKYFDKKYLEIMNKEKSINNLNKKLLEIRGEKICIECEEVNEQNATVCKKCKLDLKLDNSMQIDYNNMDTIIESVKIDGIDDEIICPNCGHKSSRMDKFCLQCGIKFDT